jgi:hypothetical protein
MREPFYEDVSFDNISSIINYIKNNYIKFLLLLLSFFIIVVVDHISHLNAIIFSLPYVISGVQSQHVPIQNNQNKKRKTTKK